MNHDDFNRDPVESDEFFGELADMIDLVDAQTHERLSNGEWTAAATTSWTGCAVARRPPQPARCRARPTQGRSRDPLADW